MDSDPLPISSAWLAWLTDFELVGRRIAEVLTESGSDDLESERISLRFALYARALTLVGACRILAEADKLLDLRIYTRGVLGSVIHLEASLEDPGHLAALKDDDAASRRSRSMSFIKRRPQLSRRDLKSLNDFIAGKKGAKRLNISDLPDGRLKAIRHEYNEISADAAHVTFTSLVRHVQAGPDGVNRMIIDPAPTSEELNQTLKTLGLACLIGTWLLIRGCHDADVDTQGLDTLATRLRELRKDGTTTVQI